MKVKTSLKKEKKGDKIVKRGGILYRINKEDPRRKARQPKPKKTKMQRPKRKQMRSKMFKKSK
jgi:ribosomal protein L36